MAGSVRSIQPDLTGGPTASSPKEQRIGAPEFEIERVKGDVWYRFRLEGGTWKPLQENTVFTARPDAGDFGFIYLHSAGDATAEVDLAIREDFCKSVQAQPKVEVEGTVSTQSVSGKDPTRLGGALASGTNIADGAEASEEVDVAGLDQVRVCAKVSGISSFGDLNVASRNGAIWLATYETPGGEARVATVDGSGQTLRIYDATDPRNLTLLGSFNGTVGTNWDAVEVDGPDEVAVLAVSDTGTSNTILATVDVSNPGSMSSLQGQVNLNTNNPFQPANFDGVALDPDRDRFALAGKDGAAFRLLVGEYSAPGTPTKVGQDGQLVTDGIEYSVQDGILWGMNGSGGNMELHAFRTSSGVSHVGNRLTLSGPDWSGPGTIEELDNGEMFLVGDSEGAALVGVDGVDAWKILETDHTGGNSDLRADERTAVDPTNRVAWIPFYKSLNGALILRAWDIDQERELGRTGEMTGGGSQSGHSAYFSASAGVPFTIEAQDSALGSVDYLLGRDELRVIPLNPSGGRQENPPGAATLTDGREVCTTVTVEGEHKIEVEIAARSGQQATVEYVDVYPREL